MSISDSIWQTTTTLTHADRGYTGYANQMTGQGKAIYLYSTIHTLEQFKVLYRRKKTEYPLATIKYTGMI